MKNFTASEKYVRTGEFNTRYWEEGDGEVVILLHGGGAGADAYGNFRSNFATFAKAGFRVLAFDAVGYGKTDKPDPKQFSYAEESRVNQLLNFMEALQLQDVTLVGNSMGGQTSIGAVLKQPEKVKRLILMGSGGRRKVEKASDTNKEQKSLFDYEIGKEYMYNVLRNLTNEEFEVDEEYLEYRLELTKMPGTMEAYRATMHEFQQGLPYFDDAALQSIRHNTLLIHGKNDRMIPVELAYEFLEHLPNSWLYVMPHCGHWAMLEYPEEFARVCVDFIRNH